MPFLTMSARAGKLCLAMGSSGPSLIPDIAVSPSLRRLNHRVSSVPRTGETIRGIHVSLSKYTEIQIDGQCISAVNAPRDTHHKGQYRYKARKRPKR